MLNRFPLWKYALIAFVLGLGGLYALPNLYPDQPAVQISPAEAGVSIGVSDRSKLERALEQAGVANASLESTEDGRLTVRVNDLDSQLLAKDVVKSTLGEKVIVALNLVTTIPDWLASLGAYPMTLGLDLRGGVHFLMEVDMEKAVEARLKVYDGTVRSEFRKARLRYRYGGKSNQGAAIYLFRNEQDQQKAVELVKEELPSLLIRGIDWKGKPALSMSLTEALKAEIEDYAIEQNLVTLRNRVNELGVAEPIVQRQGANRIVVELPGVQDTATAKRILGKTANLEFRLEVDDASDEFDREVLPFRQGDRTAELERAVIVTGDRVTNAQSNFDEHGQPQVNIDLDGPGGDLMFSATRNNIGRRMAVVFVEQKQVFRTEESVNELGETVTEEVSSFVAHKSLISLATVQSALGSRFRITGLNGAQESSELALLLRAGALAAPMFFVEERTIGPSLGAENIALGVTSVQIGGLLVVLFMLAYYRAFGVAANVALTVNLILIVAVMSMLGATLTLPGIAGIVLTVGMAVDANVLIFSRIKEELSSGYSAQEAVHRGYDRAFVTILDANITTLLVAVILYAVGTGPVKGFAITLSVGILTSLFTAILLTRAMVNLAIGGRRVEKLWI